MINTHPRFSLSPRLAAMALLASVAATGCESLALTAFGVGSAAGVSHTLNGYAYRVEIIAQTERVLGNT